MRVILLQNIKGVGRMGDIKDVSDGYGRNYLLSRNLAKVATEGTVKESEALRKKADTELKIANEKAKEIAEKSKDIVLEFTKKSSKTGTLFASLTKEEIAVELSKAVGGKVDPDSIDLGEHGEHIKQEGEHMVSVELAPEIKIEVKVVVKPE
jgi:large subunit ribosomal protein L9